MSYLKEISEAFLEAEGLFIDAKGIKECSYTIDGEPNIQGLPYKGVVQSVESSKEVQVSAVKPVYSSTIVSTISQFRYKPLAKQVVVLASAPNQPFKIDNVGTDEQHYILDISQHLDRTANP